MDKDLVISVLEARVATLENRLMTITAEVRLEFNYCNAFILLCYTYFSIFFFKSDLFDSWIDLIKIELWMGIIDWIYMKK